MTLRNTRRGLATVYVIVFATSCSGHHALPRLSPARSASLSSCAELATAFRFAHTTITAAVAPDDVVAVARGPGNTVGVNPDVPSGWAANRSRPLCSYPKVARLRAGAANLETTDSFSCR